jgi:hypothetical protein
MLERYCYEYREPGRGNAPITSPPFGTREAAIRDALKLAENRGVTIVALIAPDGRETPWQDVIAAGDVG